MMLDGIVSGTYPSSFVAAPGDSAVRFTGIARERAIKRAKPYEDILGTVDGVSCRLVKPLTFMNNSGRAISYLLRTGKIRDINEMLIVHDDVDLNVGTIRFREKGSAGGHNGLKSIIAAIGTQEFSRLKVGVGPRPQGAELVDCVLGSFRPDEYEELESAFKRSAPIIDRWVTGGIEKARQVLSSQLS